MAADTRALREAEDGHARASMSRPTVSVEEGTVLQAPLPPTQ